MTHPVVLMLAFCNEVLGCHYAIAPLLGIDQTAAWRLFGYGSVTGWQLVGIRILIRIVSRWSLRIGYQGILQGQIYESANGADLPY